MAAIIVVVVVTGWAVVAVDGVLPFDATWLVEVDGAELELSDFWLGKRIAYDGGGSISS